MGWAGLLREIIVDEPPQTAQIASVIKTGLGPLNCLAARVYSKTIMTFAVYSKTIMPIAVCIREKLAFPYTVVM